MHLGAGHSPLQVGIYCSWYAGGQGRIEYCFDYRLRADHKRPKYHIDFLRVFWQVARWTFRSNTIVLGFLELACSFGLNYRYLMFGSSLAV